LIQELADFFRRNYLLFCTADTSGITIMQRHLARIASAITLLVCLFGISACGQKGDLYLPEQSAASDGLYRQHT
jgi:predicted small lipoprotein YifL